MAQSTRRGASPPDCVMPPRPRVRAARTAVAGDGNRHALSCTRPSPNTTRGATAATSGCASSTSARRATDPGSEIVSGFSRYTYGAVVARISTLLLAPNPSRRSPSITRTPGYAARIASTVPSPETLSSTTISASASPCSDSRHASTSSRVSMLTIRTATRATA